MPATSPVPLAGTVAPGLEPVRDAFAAVLDPARGDLAETGAAVCVVKDGAVVVDLVGGWADAARTRPWTHDTLVHVFSVSKPFAALATVTVVRDGALHLDRAVADVWPEYAARGKGGTTLRDVLRHRAGLPAFPPGCRPLDATGLEDALAAAAPAWEPGTAQAEHALTYGHLLAGAVRRATGRSLGTVLREELAGPLGLDVHLGVPAADLSRVADLEAAPGWPDSVGEGWRPVLAEPSGVLDPALLNGTGWRTGEFGAIGLHASARGIAGLYATLTDRDGPLARVLGAALHAEALAVPGPEPDLLIGSPVSWTVGGFQADEEGLGMGGIGGCLGYRSLRWGYAGAYVTRRLADHARCDEVLDALERLL